jgi:hypothetical protein
MQRHERALIAVALAALALYLAALFVWGVWFGGAERAIDRWNAQTTRELAHAEALVAAERWDEAAAELERIDAHHPAVYVRHRLDRERERVLELLGQCWVELDRKRRALDVFERLVQFDPRNWRNHWLEAEALRHFGDGDEAQAAYREVLRIHPNHLPTVEALTGLYFDVSTLYANVVELHRAYLDAQLLGTVELALGEEIVRFDVPVDGRAHALSAPLEVPAGWKGVASLRTHGYSASPGALSFDPPTLVGVLGREGSTRVEGPWRAVSASETRPGHFAASAVDSALLSEVELSHGASRVAIEIALFKAMTPSLWSKVETSYRNRLLFDELEAVKARTVVGGCAQGGSVFEE